MTIKGRLLLLPAIFLPGKCLARNITNVNPREERYFVIRDKIQEGNHDLNIKRNGYKPIEQSFKIKRRETTALDFILVPMAKEENKSK